MRILNYLGRGILHERMKLPCQDVTGCAVHENGNTVMVLSDGAGASRYALEAAQANVDAVLAYFRTITASKFAELSPEEGSRAVISACQLMITKRFDDLEHTRRSDVCATLLFIVHDGERMVAGHLGDGLIHIRDHTGCPILHSLPQNLGDDSNQTMFTIQSDAWLHLRLYTFEAARAHSMLLTSDGTWTMFQNRSGGRPEITAGELLDYICREQIITREDLAAVLFRMCRTPRERLDDWSFLIACTGLEGSLPSVPPTISMQTEELEKREMKYEVKMQ